MTLPPSARQLQILSAPYMTGERAFETCIQHSSSEDQANDECSQLCSDTKSGAKVEPERLPSAGKAKETFSLQAIEAFLCQRPGTCATDASNEQEVITSAEDMSEPAETDIEPRMAHTLDCLPDDEHQSNKSAKETSSTRSARRQTARKPASLAPMHFETVDTCLMAPRPQSPLILRRGRSMQRSSNTQPQSKQMQASTDCHQDTHGATERQKHYRHLLV